MHVAPEVFIDGNSGNSPAVVCAGAEDVRCAGRRWVCLSGSALERFSAHLAVALSWVHDSARAPHFLPLDGIAWRRSTVTAASKFWRRANAFSLAFSLCLASLLYPFWLTRLVFGPSISNCSARSFGPLYSGRLNQVVLPHCLAGPVLCDILVGIGHLSGQASLLDIAQASASPYLWEALRVQGAPPARAVRLLQGLYKGCAWRASLCRAGSARGSGFNKAFAEAARRRQGAPTSCSFAPLRRAAPAPHSCAPRSGAHTASAPRSRSGAPLRRPALARCSGAALRRAASARRSDALLLRAAPARRSGGNTFCMSSHFGAFRRRVRRAWRRPAGSSHPAPPTKRRMSESPGSVLERYPMR